MYPAHSFVHGALIHAAPGNTHGATVERQQIGEQEARMILTIESAYATPALESMKSDFLNAERIDAAFVEKLVSLAAPPFGGGGAVAITQGSTAFAASVGNGRCFVERGAALIDVGAGVHPVVIGDRWLVTTGAAPLSTGPIFDVSPVSAPAGFSNNTLDDALAHALRSHPGPIATATTWVVAAAL